jgi:putative nucleotidyltransferase with HDIG domain
MPKVDQDLLDFLTKLSDIVTQQQNPAYIIGGFVRDWLAGRKTEDVDIAVQGDALSIARKLAAATGGKYVLLDATNKVARVVVQGQGQWHLDLSAFSGSVEDDLARRDFTINAMAFKLESIISGAPRLIDPFSGKADLKNKLIRGLNQDIFREDSARLLRAVRIAAELGFKIDSLTEKTIQIDCDLVKSVPAERLREELVRMLALPGASALLRYLDILGLLIALIPELAELKDFEQPKEHYWDVFNHSIETVATAEFLLREKDWKYGKHDLLKVTSWSDEISEHFDEKVSGASNRRVLLKLGALMHDIAKPLTKTVDESGRTRFLGHSREGAAIAVRVMERLRFSSRETKLIENLVYHHLRPAQMSNNGLPTSRAVFRYFRDTESAGTDILFLALADYLATHGPKLDIKEWKHHNLLINFILAEHSRQDATMLPARLIDGHDLMNTFGLEPGPLVGRLLTQVREAQAAQEINTREEALGLVRKELERRQCGTAC